MVVERDEEISKIVDKLGDDMHADKKQVQMECEERVRYLEERHESELKDLFTEMAKLRDQYLTSEDEKSVLDDQLQMSQTRVQVLESDIVEKNKRLMKLERSAGEQSNQVDLIYEDQDRKLQDLELQFRHRIELKDADIRKLKTEIQGVQNKQVVELEKIRDKHRIEVTQIQEKVH